MPLKPVPTPNIGWALKISNSILIFSFLEILLERVSLKLLFIILSSSNSTFLPKLTFLNNILIVLTDMKLLFI